MEEMKQSSFSFSPDTSFSRSYEQIPPGEVASLRNSIAEKITMGRVDELTPDERTVDEFDRRKREYYKLKRK